VTNRPGNGAPGPFLDVATGGATAPTVHHPNRAVGGRPGRICDAVSSRER
jgi:hypothetical protein